MAVTKNFPFDTPSNYTFDSNEIEITGGKAKLKDQRPGDSTFFAKYGSNVNGTWGNGILTGTPSGGAAVSGGFLDLTYGDKRYVDYDAVLNANSQQTLCIRFVYKPNFITPVGEHVVFSINKEYNNLSNLIYYRDTGSHHRLHIFDSSGTLIEECYFGYSQWVVNQEYEIEFNIDITTGATRMFIDGIQFGVEKTSTGIRDTNINLFRIGSNYKNATNSNFKIKDFIVFSTVQHITDYTPGQSIPQTIYLTSNPAITINDVWYIEALEGFSETSAVIGSDAITYLVYKGSADYYYSGGWIASDGTYAQTTSAADIEANKATYTTERINFKVKIFLHSDDGSTTPEIDLLSIDYNYAGETENSIARCIVSGYAEGGVDSKIKIYLENENALYKNNVQIYREYYYPEVDSNKYWEQELIETGNMANNDHYIFEINGRKYRRKIPNEATKEFNLLTEN